jgi:hypothetical protein
MAFLLIIPAWILLLSVVVALCRAARLGDVQPREELTRSTPELPSVVDRAPAVAARTAAAPSRRAGRPSNAIAHAGGATG